MLIVEDLEVGYGSTPILKGLQLEAQRGEIHGILGINGSGKTTLFRTINGWLPKWAGTMTLYEEPLHPKQVSYLETDPYFYPYIKGIEYLRILKGQKVDYNINKWNEVFNLPLDRLAEDYSTGMKKKLALMGLLAQDRSLMILDEPLNGVDIESNVKFTEILIRLKNSNRVVLMSSHMIDSLTSICDKISLLSEGVIGKTFIKSEIPNLKQIIENQIRLNLDGQLDELMGPGTPKPPTRETI